MPSYIPDPYEYIAAQRDAGRDGYGFDLGSEGLRVNFRRKPWNPSSINKPEEPDFVAATLGSTEFNARDYLADAQVPSAYAETLANDARQQAAEALEKYGDVLDPQSRKKLEQIAQVGQQDDGTNWFTNALNILDAPGELIRMGIADLFVDEDAGVEITGADYWDAIIGNEDKVRERLGDDFVGDGQFLLEGSRILKAAGMGTDESHWGRGALGIALDIVVDPLTYVSFGTVGLGKKVAMEGAQAGIQRASREAIEAVSKNAVGDLTDAASREVAQRIEARIANQIDSLDGGVIERLQKKDTIRRRVLAEENRALDASIGQAVPRREILDKGLVDEDLAVPFGTVVEELNNQVLPLIAEKQFKTLAEVAPWYSKSHHVPGFAKGGVQVGAPFGRKRFPMLRIPGTETNRLASALLGRKQVSSLFDKMPAGFQTWMRDLGQRTGVEKAAFRQAKEGSLWRVQAEMNMRDILIRQVLPAEALRPLAHGIEEVRKVADDLGMEKGEADKAVRQLLNGDTAVLEQADPKFRAALVEAVDGDAERGIDGIRQVFSTFYDAARRVGMDMGQVPNYSPLVVDGSFSKFLDRVKELGIDVPVGQGSTPMSNLGLAIIGRYLNNAGESALGVAGRDVTYTQFAQSNKVTQLFRSFLGGVRMAEDLSNDVTLAEMLNVGGMFRLSADTANEAVTAALDDLIARNPGIRKQARTVDQAFTTDMIETFNVYVASMGEAVQFRDLIRRLRRVGLIEGKNKMIDVSATLAGVKGRMSDEMASWIDELAEGNGTTFASRLVSVKAGGRSFKVPATVAASPNFKKVASAASRAFSRFDTKANEIRSAVALERAKLIDEGIPEEIADSLAFASADSDLSKAMDELADLALAEVDTIQSAAMEAAARGAIDPDAAIGEAMKEARKIMAGVQKTLAEMEDQARKALNLPQAGSESKAIDLLAGDVAPKGHANTLSAMGRWAMDSLERRIGKLAEFAEAKVAAGPSLQGASRQRMAKEAAADLADRATVTNLTVGELAEFASPRVAARVVTEMNGRLLEAGYDGMDSLTEEIMEAAEEVFAAEFRFFTQGGKEAEKALSIAERQLDEVSESLRESDELLGGALDHVVETVADVNDAILVSPVWRDVWAASIHKLKGLPRGEFEKTADNLTQNQFYGRKTSPGVSGMGEKSVAREVADITRGLWAKASGIEAERLAERSARELNEGASAHRRVIQAMLESDTEVLAARPEIFREVVASITDKNGRALFDPARLVVRPNGQIVYEVADPTWVTLDDVWESVVRIAGDQDISDMEMLSNVKTTWDETPEVIESVDPKLGEFFRQVDAEGGLPYDIENYEYLRRFVADLEGIEPAVRAEAAGPDELALAMSGLRKFADEPKIIRRNLERLATGERIPVDAERLEAEAVASWWHKNAKPTPGLYRGMELDAVPAVGSTFDVAIGNATRNVEEAASFASGENQWIVVFDDLTPAAVNPSNTNTPLVSGRFQVSSVDDTNRVVRVSAEYVEPVLPFSRTVSDIVPPKEVKVAIPKIRSILDEVDKAFKTGNARKLEKLWDENVAGLHKVLGPEEMGRLLDIVNKAGAAEAARSHRFGDSWRSLIGSADETADKFASDVAMMRRQAWDLGEEWAGQVAEDAVAFRDAFERLLSFADDLDEGGVRRGFQPLEDFGGPFDAAFGEVRSAATKLRKTVSKSGEKRQLAAFLPPIPDDVRSMDSWLKELEKEMKGWQPVPTSTSQKGYVSPKVEQLGGAGLQGLEMTPGVALMFDHLAASSIAVASPLGIRLAAEAYREAEQYWKAAATVARPTFVPRNVFSGIVNGLLVGVGPTHYAAVRNHVWSFRRNLDELGVDGAIEALPKNFQPYMRGLWDSGLLTTSFAHTLDRLKPAAELGELVNPLSSQNALFRVGGKVMETSEDFLRAAAFIRWYDPNDPATLKLAKEMALAVHFDYTALTQMETAIKRFVPFFVWTRRNLPLQMRAMVEQPGHITRLLHVKENVNAESDGTFVDEIGFAQSPYLSAFAMKTPFIFDAESPHWQRLLLDPALPVADLEEALKAVSEGPQGVGEWLIRSLSPAFGGTTAIFEDYDTVAPTGLREILMAADHVLPGEGVAGFDPVLSGDYQGPAFLSNIFRTASPMLAEWTRLAGVVPSSGSQAIRGGINIEDGVTADERALASVLGLGRAFGATLQTPEDTRSAAFDAIFGIEDMIDDMKMKGQIIETEDLSEVIETILKRQGIDPAVLDSLGPEEVEEDYALAG